MEQVPSNAQRHEKERTPWLERIMRYFDGLREPSRTGAGPNHQLPPPGFIPLLPDQYMYAVDYRSGKVFMADGFERVLGYRDADIDLEHVFSYIHPEDQPAVTAVVERALRSLFSSTDRVWPLAAVMSIDYRVRKANGEYIKVLRNVCVIEVDTLTGKALTTLSICKDISNIKQSNTIGWQCMGPGTDDMDMSDILPGLPNVIYRPSAREMDVLAKMVLGMESAAIALQLNISLHTVNTHRKNLLQRTGMPNALALIAMAKEQGWV